MNDHLWDLTIGTGITVLLLAITVVVVTLVQTSRRVRRLTKDTIIVDITRWQKYMIVFKQGDEHLFAGRITTIDANHHERESWFNVTIRENKPEAVHYGNVVYWPFAEEQS